MLVRKHLLNIWNGLWNVGLINLNAAAWLAQLGELRSAEQEVAGSSPGRTNTQGLEITEKKVLPL